MRSTYEQTISEVNTVPFLQKAIAAAEDEIRQYSMDKSKWSRELYVGLGGITYADLAALVEAAKKIEVVASILQDIQTRSSGEVLKMTEKALKLIWSE